MHANLLHVFTAIANPIGWKSRITLAKAFFDHMLASGVAVTVVECAYGETPFVLDGIKNVRHIGVRAVTRGWTKENQLNIAIRRTPEAKYIAWIDADVYFRNWQDPTSNWAAQTVRALQHYAILQPWTDCLDLGPNDEIIAHHQSFCRQWFHKQPVVPAGTKWWKSDGGPYCYPHSGYAWAITRAAYDQIGGLFEVGGMGSGDHHMALGLIGRADASMPRGTHPRYAEHVMRWQARALQHINYNIGVVRNTIEHQFHGRKIQRNYIGRWDTFLKHQFNPDEDLKRNSWDILEFASNKPQLRHDFDLYLLSRSEDANTLD